MRLSVITPLHVTEKELARRAARYRDLAPGFISIEMMNLPAGPDVPRTLDTAEAIRSSEDHVYSVAMQTDPAEYDAIFLDCVLDPGLDRLEKEAQVPTFGILKLSAGYLASIGHVFAAVTRNQVIGDELVDRLTHYGLMETFDRLTVLNLSFEDIADDDRWNQAIAAALGPMRKHGVQSLINGCSAVDVYPEVSRGVAVVDPTALALQLVGVAVESGIVASRPKQVKA